MSSNLISSVREAEGSARAARGDKRDLAAVLRWGGEETGRKRRKERKRSSEWGKRDLSLIKTDSCSFTLLIIGLVLICRMTSAVSTVAQSCQIQDAQHLRIR